MVAKLVCSHPKVEKIWEWGGLSINPTAEAQYYLSILLKDGERKDFQGLDAEEQAEKYLHSL